MSLTSYLSGKAPKAIEFQNIIKSIQPTKKEFLTLSKCNAFSEPIKAPYILTNQYHSTIVGITFDYLARFMISQKITNNKNEVISDLVAKQGLYILERNVDKKTNRELKKLYDNAISYTSDFISSNQTLTEKLIYNSYFLGKLEQIARCGMMPDKISNVTDLPVSEIVEDLLNLCNVFKTEFLDKVVNKDSMVIFNPHFGNSSRMVGGADADVFIDGVLYDFKCTKNTGYRGKDIQQIIGYYLFNRINIEQNDDTSKFFIDGEILKIKSIAIYNARSGQINYVDTINLDEDKVRICIDKIIEMFKDDLKHINMIHSLLSKVSLDTKPKKILSKDIADRIVYTTEKGKTYHNSKDCISLQLCKNIQEVSLYDIRIYKKQCSICKNK